MLTLGLDQWGSEPWEIQRQIPRRLSRHRVTASDLRSDVNHGWFPPGSQLVVYCTQTYGRWLESSGPLSDWFGPDLTLIWHASDWSRLTWLAVFLTNTFADLTPPVVFMLVWVCTRGPCPMRVCNWLHPVWCDRWSAGPGPVLQMYWTYTLSDVAADLAPVRCYKCLCPRVMGQRTWHRLRPALSPLTGTARTPRRTARVRWPGASAWSSSPSASSSTSPTSWRSSSMMASRRRPSTRDSKDAVIRDGSRIVVEEGCRF